MPRLRVIAGESGVSRAGGSLSPRIRSAELLFVRRCTSSKSGACFLAVLGSKLGNGWAYPLLAFALVCTSGAHMLKAMLVAAVCVALLHAVYPFVKARVARPRPFDADPGLRSLLPPLDRHSFPSGHLMTFTAVAVPVGIAFPASVAPLLGLWLFIAWARIACAHHYPSDILAGSLMAFTVSTPLALWSLT